MDEQNVSLNTFFNVAHTLTRIVSLNNVDITLPETNIYSPGKAEDFR